MRVAPLALLLALAAPGHAVTLSFEESAPTDGEGAALSEQYAGRGVHFLGSDDGSVWSGRSQGDPGRWGLEGRSGPAFLGFNGRSYALDASFDAPVRALRLDVANSYGAEPGARFVLEGYREGVLVARESVELGGVDEWLTAGLDAEIDRVRWRGEDDRFHPFGVDNLRWIPATAEPAAVEVEVRPGSRKPLDPAAGGLMAAIVFGSAALPVEAIDETTLAMGPDGAGVAQRASLHVRDVDGDGCADLVALYRVSETGLAAADREICLTGETFEGAPFEGCTGLLLRSRAD